MEPVASQRKTILLARVCELMKLMRPPESTAPARQAPGGQCAAVSIAVTSSFSFTIAVAILAHAPGFIIADSNEAGVGVLTRSAAGEGLGQIFRGLVGEAVSVFYFEIHLGCITGRIAPQALMQYVSFRRIRIDHRFAGVYVVDFGLHLLLFDLIGCDPQDVDPEVHHEGGEEWEDVLNERMLPEIELRSGGWISFVHGRASPEPQSGSRSGHARLGGGAEGGSAGYGNRNG